MDPFLRFVLPIFDAEMPSPATALPDVSSGAHSFAQLPEHVLLPPLSFSNRYKVRPLPSTRIRPVFTVRTWSFAFVVAWWTGCADAGAMMAMQPTTAANA